MSNSSLTEMITSSRADVRDRALDDVCRGWDLERLVEAAQSLDTFWRQTDNLYYRVRALFFLAAIHRYHLPPKFGQSHQGLIPFEAYQHLMERRFVESIDSLLQIQSSCGPNDGISSALAQAYHELGFQTLANQVRRSVRNVRGNQWMFRTGHPEDHPLRFHRSLLNPIDGGPLYPLLKETTAVRMDFSHSGWSDIFFLGMDYPEGARVINASINLGVTGRDDCPRPPIECYLRVIDRPILRLVSVDLKSVAEITTLPEVFDFARDYLGLLKAALIAAGIVPAGMEGCDLGIASLLSRLVGPGLGLEIVSKVNDIPKGSRLAVSTNLLGSLISICMRATGQVSSLEGRLTEGDRRIIAARAILGEWIGGSGGGWQDSGGVWPGIKAIQGAIATNEDPEFGISRGRLLPSHRVFSQSEVTPETRRKLQDSLVLVHGGMAQNVGPILEMVTEKYLLRSPKEWAARKEAMRIYDAITEDLTSGNIRAIGKSTNDNFFGPLQAIIPWCTNLFTNTLVDLSKREYGDQFWGFWMLGGMAGGGMGFIFDPSIKEQAKTWLQDTMQRTKRDMESRLPFAMEPVVYDFEINDQGSSAMLDRNESLMPDGYYALLVPDWLKSPPDQRSRMAQVELERIGDASRTRLESARTRQLIDSIFPAGVDEAEASESLDELLTSIGFDQQQHEQIREELKSGHLGMAQNRLPRLTSIEDVHGQDVVDTRWSDDARHRQIGEDALRNGKVAVVTLAAGVGSRWTEGAGVVKALHPFCQFAGRHRSFLEIHLAKSRQAGDKWGTYAPHVFTTGYLTDQAIRSHLALHKNHNYPGRVAVSTGRYVGLRMIPLVRDLQFFWNETPQQLLDERQQKGAG